MAGERNIRVKFSGDTDGLRQASSNAQRNLRGLSDAAGDVQRSLNRTARESEKSADRLERFGSAADDVDTRAMGFHDALTGLQDSMMGVGDLASGRTFQGLLLMGSGISDLGSSVYNTLAPALTSARDRMKALGEAGTSTREKLKRFGKGAGIAGLAIGGLLATTYALDSAFGHKLNPQIDAITAELHQLAKTGETSGEIVRVLGGNFNELGDAVDAASKPLAGFFAWSERTLHVGDLFNESISKSQDRISALDKALSRMDPRQAQRALEIVANRAGLTKEQYRELKNMLPLYRAQQNKANAATDKAAQALEAQIVALRKATNPVFALTAALQGVNQAQRAYTHAVNKYGHDSPQARTASINLAKAVAGAEAAAKNGDLSFTQFRKKLNQWVSAGIVTRKQADNIANAVRRARGQAERYQKGSPYNATLGVRDHASYTIGRLLGSLAGFEGVHTATLTTAGSALNDLRHGRLPGRAGGGSVEAGQTYVVGERGPELFTPRQSGVITPNSQPTGAPVSVRVFIGDQELRDLVRVEIDEDHRDVRQRVLAGAGALR